MRSSKSWSEKAYRLLGVLEVEVVDKVLHLNIMEEGGQDFKRIERAMIKQQIQNAQEQSKIVGGLNLSTNTEERS